MRLQAGLGDGHRLICGRLLPGEQFNRPPNYPAVLLFVPRDPRAHPPVLQHVEDTLQVQRPSSLGQRLLVIPVELVTVFRVQRGANLAGLGARSRQRRQGWVVRRGRRAGHAHTISQPDDHRAERDEFVRQLLEAAGIGDRSNPGELDRQRPVLFLLLGGEVDFDFGRAAGVGEGRIPALEVAGQVVVQDGGTDLEEELGARW